MVNRYETVFILTPVLSDDQVKETVKKFEDLLKSLGANITYQDHWGLRKLAYPIQKKSTGFYHLFEHELEGSQIARLEIEMKRDERIMRFLSIKMDKHSIKFAESRRKTSTEQAPAEA